MTDTKNRLCKTFTSSTEKKSDYLFIVYYYLMTHCQTMSGLLFYIRALEIGLQLFQNCRNKTRMNHAFNSLWYIPRIVFNCYTLRTTAVVISV